MRTGAARVTAARSGSGRVSKKGIVFQSLRHTMATLLARAKMHPSVAQKILRHANIETTLAIGSREHPTMQVYAAPPHCFVGRASAERRRPDPRGAGVDRCVSSGSGSVHCPLLLGLLGGQREARLGGTERSEQRARRVVAHCRPVLEAVARAASNQPDILQLGMAVDEKVA